MTIGVQVTVRVTGTVPMALTSTLNVLSLSTASITPSMDRKMLTLTAAGDW